MNQWNNWIKTGDELPKEGQRVEYMSSPEMWNNVPGIGIFEHGRFVITQYRDWTGSCIYAANKGVWRPVTAQPEQQNDIQGIVERLQADLAQHSLENYAKLDAANTLVLYLNLENGKLREHSRNLEKIISGQRKALASKHAEVYELKKELKLVNTVLDDRMLQLCRLEHQLQERDKMSQLYLRPWIPSTDPRTKKLKQWGLKGQESSFDVVEIKGAGVEGIQRAFTDSYGWHIIGKTCGLTGCKGRGGNAGSCDNIPFENTFWRNPLD